MNLCCLLSIFFVFCYKTLLLGFLNHLNTTFISILYFNQICKCYVVLNGLQRYIFPLYVPQVLLRSLEAPVSSQMGPLVATGRIVADWKEYKYIRLTLF